MALATVSVAALAFAGAAQAVTIDTFETDQSLSLSSVGTASNAVSGAGIVGGTRVVIGTITATNGNSLDILIDNGNANYSTGSQVNGNARFEWDGDGTVGINTTGLGGVDLSDGGLQDLVRYAVTSDDLPATLTLTVWDMTGGMATGVTNLPGGILPGALTFFDEDFSDFSGSVDFSDVGAIALDIDAPANTDLTFDFLETAQVVPEPGTLAVLGFSILGLGVLRRHRH